MMASGRIRNRLSQSVLGLLAIFLLSGCEKDKLAPEPTLTISLYEVGAAIARGERTYHGRVIPADLTRVAFRIPGKISELSIQSGQVVQEGQAIARIDDSMMGQMLADARAQYQLSRRQLKRAEDLYEMGSLTPAQRDELKAAFRLAKANLELARTRQSYTEVVAPFDGTVLDVDKELFESVAPGETVVTLYRNHRTDVLVNVSDDLTSRMHQFKDNNSFNLRVRFAGGRKSHPIEYLKHSSARNPQSQAFQYWLTMPSTEADYAPGTPVTITADLGSAGFTLDSGLVVPLTALEAGSQSGSFRVWRYLEGRVDPVPVTIGAISTDGVMVTSGLQAGDLVVDGALARLVPGLAVNLHEGEGR